MPLPIAGGVFAWLVGLFGSLLGSFTTWLMQRMVYERAVHIALVTAFLVAAGALTVTLSVTIKALVLSARTNLPSFIAAGTYFLPSNLNVILSVIITARVSVALYRWTVATFASYLPGSPSIGLTGRGITS